jgi:hypothetical protein
MTTDADDAPLDDVDPVLPDPTRKDRVGAADADVPDG